MKNDGGPAYPIATVVAPLQGYQIPKGGVGSDGMSLRQWYAGMVITGLVASLDREDVNAIQHMSNEERAQMVARYAFLIADAMIKASEETDND